METTTSSTFTVRVVFDISVEYDPKNYDGDSKDGAMAYERRAAESDPIGYVSLLFDDLDGENQTVTVTVLPS